MVLVAKQRFQSNNLQGNMEESLSGEGKRMGKKGKVVGRDN